MTAEELEALRNRLKSVRLSLEQLKATAQTLSAAIDGQSLLREEAVNALASALQSYRENAALLLRSGAELASTVEPQNLSALDRALDEMEAQLKRSEAVKQLVLDYLRLTADAEAVRTLLEQTKAALEARFTLSDLPEAFLAPYRIVVETVKSGSALSEEDYDLVSEHMGRPMARALDRCQLSFMPEEVLPPEEPESVARSEASEEERADISGSEAEESAEEEDPPEAGFSFYEEDVRFTLQDTPASQLGAKKFKNDLLRHPDFLRALYYFGDQKLAREEETRPPEAGAYLPGKEIIRYLRKENYLAELTLDADGESFRYLTLSSKAWAAYKNSSIVSFLKGKGWSSAILPRNASSPASGWSKADALRVHWLCRYFDAGAEVANYTVYTRADKPFFAVDEARNYVLLPAVAERRDPKGLSASIAALLEAENICRLVLLIGAASDIPLLLSALAREYPEQSFDLAVLRFCVVGQFDILLDSEGIPCPFEESTAEEEVQPEPTEEPPAAEDEMPEEADETVPDEAAAFPLPEAPETPAAESVAELAAISLRAQSVPESDSVTPPEEAQPTLSAPVPPVSSSAHALTLAPAEVKAAVKEMLSGGKLYCATAFLKSLSQCDSRYESAYIRLAYALNDPLCSCNYSSESILSVFYSENGEPPEEEYLISAALRSYFSDKNPFDYGVQTLQSTISGLELFSSSSALSQVAYILSRYKAKFNIGMETYADYRQKDLAHTEQRISELRKDASELLFRLVDSKTRENASFKRFVETQKIIFARDGDLAECLRIVESDKREELDYIRMILEFYISDSMPVSAENLSERKMDLLIQSAWLDAEKNLMLKKNSSTLMSSRYTNLFMNIRRILTLLCDYLSAVEHTQIDQNAESFKEYRRLHDELLNGLDTALCDLSEQSVLTATLRELRRKLDGSYPDNAHRYFYVDFLRRDDVLLDENYLPLLESVQGLESMSAEMRILHHFNGEESSFSQRLESIYNGGDDFGSAALILRYINLTGEESVEESYEENYEAASRQPLEYVKNQYQAFEANLEMAQSQGQIDNTEGNYKDSVLYTVEQWRSTLEESRNYGFFDKILNAFKEQIREKARARAVDLNASLYDYLSDHPRWEAEEISRNAVDRIRRRIETQNYTAAEDLLNRLLTGDTEADSALSGQTDYLEEFLSEYSANYAQVRDLQKTLAQQLHLSASNKDSKGGARIVDAWPTGSRGVTAENIARLFSALGFPVNSGNVRKEEPIHAKLHFTLRLNSPANGRSANYKHPIWIYGSQAEKSDLRVVCIFGRMDADRLIDTFNDIGSAKDTIILLDYPLTQPDRRKLARKAKSAYNGRSFAVIDRVAVAYLARHYTETDINRRLMAVIMPYAFFNPYVADSAQLMPPEIFIGRKAELQKIEEAGGVNIVYGGRQLGKSALLKKAKQNIDRNENGDRSILVDIKYLDHRAACKKISAALSDEHFFNAEFITEDWQELARTIKKRLTAEEPRIPYFLLLLDEADAFIESCISVQFAPFDALKDIMSLEGQRFKFVVAGLRDVVRSNRDSSLKGNTVLPHLSALTVTPFRISEARELIEQPLSYLGFRFPDNEQTDALISSICATTNYFPGLLQFYCTRLLEAMQQDYAGYGEAETPPYYVREEHVKRALADSTLLTQIRDKFFITLKADDDDYYYLIALLGAFLNHSGSGNSFTAQAIRRCAEDYSLQSVCSLSCEKINALMQEMCELNVLRFTGEAFRFSRYHFYQMMGNVTEIEDAILAYATGEEQP